MNALAPEKLRFALERWITHPVEFLYDVLHATPDPWQCDVTDALEEYDNVACRSCHGAGKTAFLAWTSVRYLVTHPFSKVPITAPTFNKQVRDVLFAEIHKWWRIALAGGSTWLDSLFELHPTRLTSRQYEKEWFAVGIASNQPINTEGYHAPHLLAIFDEAKGIKRATWEAIHGMRTTDRAKLLAVSTPGGPYGEFHKVFTEYRATWKSLFIIHPEALRAALGRQEAQPGSVTGGTYYTPRVRPEWVEERGLEWGTDSPVYVAKVIGDFPAIEGDVLIPYKWLSEAEDREAGSPGPRWVSCDVARFGKDRTVFLVGEGGTVLYGETVARFPQETTAPELHTVGDGGTPKEPRYRAIDVTADICQRLLVQWECDGVIVDDTGLGGGVTDILRGRGIKAIGINFGAAPTDRPKTPEQKAARQRRHQADSHFRNLKAQLAMALRDGFERELISLGQLPDHILRPLIAQTSLVRQDMDMQGRICIVDPDELEDESLPGTDDLEGRRSPDHFHSLLLLWGATGTALAQQAPQGGAALHGGQQLPRYAQKAGRPVVRTSSTTAPPVLVGTKNGSGPRPRAGATRTAQADHLSRYWRS